MQSSTSSASQETFPGLSDLPEGFRYKPELIEIDVERSLIESMHALDFAPFQFHGFEGKRRVVSYGWRYDFNGGGLKKAEGLPAFLLPVREAASASFGNFGPRSFSRLTISSMEFAELSPSLFQCVTNCEAFQGTAGMLCSH